LDMSSKTKKKKAMAMRGLDLRWRKGYWMAVEHRTDLPQPAKPLSHRKELGFSSHDEKEEPLTSQSPVLGCLFLQAPLYSTEASGALSQSRIEVEIWSALTRSSSRFASLLSCSCRSCSASFRCEMVSPTSLSSFRRVS